jgi:hypothetical protein
LWLRNILWEPRSILKSESYYSFSTKPTEQVSEKKL